MIRVANHGWNHEDMTKLKKEEQVLNDKTIQPENTTTLGISPSVFIPLFDLFNDETIVHSKKILCRTFSCSVKYYRPSY